MKRSALQCVVGFVGAALIVTGVVWTCKQLSSPTQLNAAQGTSGSVPTRSQQVNSTKPSGSLSLSVAQERSTRDALEPVSNAGVSPSSGQSKNKIRPTSGGGALSLTVVDPDGADNQDADYPDISGSSLPLIVVEEESENDSLAPGTFDSNVANAPILTEQNAYSPAGSPSVMVPIADELSSFENNYQENDAFPNTTPLTNDPLSAQTDSQIDDLLSSNDDKSYTEAPSELPQATNAAPVPTMNAPNTEILTLSGDGSNAPQTIGTNANATVAPTTIPTRKGSPSNALLQYITQDAVSVPTPDSKYDGAQTTQIVVEKEAPEEVQLNQVAKIVVAVKNLGQKEVSNLILRDSIPNGARFVDNSSSVVPNEQGELIWPSFNLQPQAEKKFEYSILPTQEGDFGSTATVMIAASASSVTKCSKPKLQVEVSAPESVEAGDSVKFSIVVSNVGTGVANNVSLQEVIPEGLHHPNGPVLNNNGFGSIKPGETKHIPLELQAVASGTAVNKLTIQADNCEPQTIETVISILSPMLELGISGPQNVYLERTATYQLSVKNVGDASAFDVKLIARLPEGVNFVKANNLGAYKKEDHCVYWDLAELPAKTNADIELQIETNQASQAELVFSASGPNDLNAQTTHSINIDGLAALSFNVSSSTDLVEVGKEYQYSVQIENRGTKASNNVGLQIFTPDAVSILATDGPTKATEQKGVIVFEKISSIPPKSSVTYIIKATPNASGDCRVGFQLSSDDLEPLYKEDNTRVYQ